MTISVLSQTRAATHRQAVVLCCDAKYLPYAALTLHTLVQRNPDRAFDLCITSLDALVLPPVLQDMGVRFCQIDVGDAFAGLPVNDRFSIAAYLRLALPDALGGDYDRILYLDCDIIVAGDELGAVFDLPLGDRPVAAVSDSVKWKRPGKPTKDQAALGVTGPYFNSGVMLIDCAAFEAQEVRAACIRIAGDHDPAKIHFDQTLLNLALADNWIALHPAWNWQWAIVRPMFEHVIDTQIVHFIGVVKPWADHKGELPARYRATAVRFLRTHFPDVAVANPAPDMSRRGFVGWFIQHIAKAGDFAALMAHHGADIMQVKRPKP
ncbi:glycosyltransferase family 8 protein [Yoonia sp. 208BN28-4]|uniref:glycosyltransferase family 8 protein n=1 Tax=Yoonia sp. 208BN28-4 TaxID=3126505 RepID=UPI0030AD369E